MIRNKFNISDQACIKSNKMPNTYRSKKITELNAKWKLKHTPSEAEENDSLNEQILRLKKGDLSIEQSVEWRW